MKNANPVSRCLAAVALIVILVVGLTACAEEKAPPLTAAGTGGPKTLTEMFPIRVGGKMVRMQLAVQLGEMQRGLMERRDLGRDDGMIFVYEKPQPMKFWMRNTPTALDIGYFEAGGRLEEVHPMHPFDETPMESRGNKLQFALEVNQGWFQDNGVKPGAQIDMKALTEALKARGFVLRKFGLEEQK